MPIYLKLFGDLRKKADPNVKGTLSLKLEIDDSEISKVQDILRKFNIDDSEVYHIFVNSVYAGVKKNIKNGDKVSIFPRNMALLYKWYFKREEDE
ncbi:MAG: MoaD/ThiS family protein [Candidatus Thorarchaeota archaeon]